LEVPGVCSEAPALAGVASAGRLWSADEDIVDF
jgi:hypothetical protein